MKFTISKQSFTDALSQVQHVVTNRTTLPILSNVLIEATGGQLKLTTTDLDVGVVGSVDAEVAKEGSTTLPVKRLASIIRELPAESVEVSVDSKNRRCFWMRLRKHHMLFLQMRLVMCSMVFMLLSKKVK